MADILLLTGADLTPADVAAAAGAQVRLASEWLQGVRRCRGAARCGDRGGPADLSRHPGARPPRHRDHRGARAADVPQHGARTGALGGRAHGPGLVRDHVEKRWPERVPPGVAARAAGSRETVPAIEGDRPLGTDIERLAQRVAVGDFVTESGRGGHAVGGQ